MPRWTWARWRVNRWWMLDVLSWDVWGMITFSLGSAGCGTWTPWASSWNLQTVNLYKANLGIMFKQKQSALIEDCTRHGCFLAQSKTKTWIIRHIHTICFSRLNLYSLRMLWRNAKGTVHRGFLFTPGLVIVSVVWCDFKLLTTFRRITMGGSLDALLVLTYGVDTLVESCKYLSRPVERFGFSWSPSRIGEIVQNPERFIGDLRQFHVCICCTFSAPRLIFRWHVEFQHFSNSWRIWFVYYLESCVKESSLRRFVNASGTYGAFLANMIAGWRFIKLIYFAEHVFLLNDCRVQIEIPSPDSRLPTAGNAVWTRPAWCNLTTEP